MNTACIISPDKTGNLFRKQILSLYLGPIFSLTQTTQLSKTQQTFIWTHAVLLKLSQEEACFVLLLLLLLVFFLWCRVKQGRLRYIYTQEHIHLYLMNMEYTFLYQCTIICPSKHYSLHVVIKFMIPISSYYMWACDLLIDCTLLQNNDAI